MEIATYTEQQRGEYCRFKKLRVDCPARGQGVKRGEVAEEGNKGELCRTMRGAGFVF